MAIIFGILKLKVNYTKSIRFGFFTKYIFTARHFFCLISLISKATSLKFIKVIEKKVFDHFFEMPIAFLPMDKGMRGSGVEVLGNERTN